MPFDLNICNFVREESSHENFSNQRLTGINNMQYLIVILLPAVDIHVNGGFHDGNHSGKMLMIKCRPYELFLPFPLCSFSKEYSFEVTKLHMLKKLDFLEHSVIETESFD